MVDVLQDSAGHEGVVLSAVTWEGRIGGREPTTADSRLAPSESEARRQRENPSWRP
jgi:hypothetical protein